LGNISCRGAHKEKELLLVFPGDRDIDGTTLIELSKYGLAPGVYTVTAWHAGVSYMTKLIYIPER